MAKLQAVKNLKVSTSAELLSYIINQDPILRDNIDLPVQGQSIASIGKIIVNNQRYKNAFLNVVNIIGMTIITRNHWENPWETFTNKGELSFGHQVRELIVDIANVYDYNENQNNVTRFLENVIPNVLEYIHEINFQKFYQTTTSDEQMSLAFERDDLFTLVDEIINSLYEALAYDKYLVNKYMLSRRILDGTLSPVMIDSSLDIREQVSVMKSVSEKMTFRSPKYNPAGIRKASSFDDQMTILDAEYSAKISTEVLATSYFRNDAEMKTRLAVIDSFVEQDIDRLNELFRSEDGSYLSGYTPFTDEELEQLKKVRGVILGRDFWQNYRYQMRIDGESEGRKTEFFNPVTLKTNHFLHFWAIFSTSPFENAVVLTDEEPEVTTLSVIPQEITIYPGNSVLFSAEVLTKGFANKSVTWDINEEAKEAGVKINSKGVLTTPKDLSINQISVTATSIFDNTKQATAVVTVTI